VIRYGNAPLELGNFSPDQPEMMFYLYLPLKLPMGRLHVPKRLKPYEGMLSRAMLDYASSKDLVEAYVYITAKTMYVQPGQPGNREGWHADGFGSHGDINYIWCDKNPTEFAVQDFGEISTDDKLSMIQMAERVRPESIMTFPAFMLLRLDESVVHRVSEHVEPGVRRFIKITISRHRFNNEGNSHNYLLNYSWPMIPRQLERNLDSKETAA
jgi:hypothetical protein